MNRIAKTRRGTSLLELTIAVGMLAIALVPSLRLMRDAVRWGETIHDREAVITLCVSTLEGNLATVANNWNEISTSGSFASEGFTDLRYTVLASEATANGGIPDQLMAVTITVYHDANSNSSLDTGESYTTMASKVAKMTTYTS